MKKVLLPLSTLGIAGAVSLGLLGINTATAEESAYVKREDKANNLVLATTTMTTRTPTPAPTRSHAAAGTAPAPVAAAPTAPTPG